VKFSLSTARSTYDKEDADKLRKFGMTFRKQRAEDVNFLGWSPNPDLFAKAWNDKGEIELETLEDLLAFAREWGKLIITPDTEPYSGGPRIEIYNDYVE
jgi:hypothetical protein